MDDILGSGGSYAPGPTSDGAFANCDAVPETLNGLASETRIGISPAQILKFAEGVHDTKIRWQPSETATYAPETGEHDIQITVTHTDGEARLVEYETKKSTGEQVLTDDISFSDCASLATVEVDVQVTIKSDGGALDESLTGTLRARSKSWATLSLPVEVDRLGGSFKIVSTKPAGITLIQAAIELAFSPVGVSGSFGGLFEMRSADAIGIGAGGTLAAIGDDASCDGGGLPIALDDALGEMSAQDALDLVAAVQSAKVKWRDGTSPAATLELVHDGASVCAILDPALLSGPNAPGMLRFGARLRVTSDDGRLDGDLPVTVEATPAKDGTLGQAAIALGGPSLIEATATNLESEFGIHGIDAATYDGVSVALELQVEAPETAPRLTGTLKVNGYLEPTCPPPPKDLSMGTPGCPGAAITELEVGTFSSE